MKQTVFTIAIGVMLCLPALSQLVGEQEAVMRVDDEYRLAKLHNDTAALSRVLDDNFYETNQNGNSRSKAQTIALFTSFPIQSLKTDSAQVRISGATAVVTGSQTEENTTGSDRMLFMSAAVASCSNSRIPPTVD